jgi:hypothetical protein
MVKDKGLISKYKASRNCYYVGYKVLRNYHYLSFVFLTRHYMDFLMKWLKVVI